MKIVDVGTDLYDLADKLMPNCHRQGNRLPRPIVPLEDMNVGAANAGPQNADEHVIDANSGLRNVLQPETGIGMSLDQSLHAKNSSLSRPSSAQKSANSSPGIARPYRLIQSIRDSWSRERRI